MVASLLIGGLSYSSQFPICEKGKGKATIFIGKQATPLERRAASELKKYIKLMSGAELKIVTSATNARSVILIGQPNTNPKIKEFSDKGLIKLSKDYPGSDGFIIKTLKLDKDYLILGGSSERGVLYSVYHLLEDILKLGFFWDGERIPREPTIALKDLHIVEKPFFPDRQYLQGCAFGYSTPYWDWEDWKREIEWTAKKKFNIVMLPWGGLDKKVFAQFGADLGTLTDYEKYKINLAKKVANYARALGIRTILPGYMGWVPAEFVKKHPECRYVDVKWGEAPSAAHLHPNDPMFVKVGEAFIEEYIKEYGTDHIYNIDPYPETRPGATPEEQKEIRISFPKAVSEYIKKADPKGVWYASGWAFLDRGYWPLEDVRDFLNAIPNDMFYVCDIQAESNPIYKELNYFHGKKWGFSVLLCFGGDDYLRGNLADLIRRVKEVAADPKAKNCQVFYINPEIIHYNTLYFELAAKLAWNPHVDLEEFLKDYALRRYGIESQENMVRVLLKLADSVYGQLGGEEALYQHRLYSLPPPSLNREKVIKDLREAIELALREKGKQKDNPLYQHDLVDILRQYITELFNIHIKKLNLSFQNADKAGFEKEAKVIGHLMDGLEKLLASREDYRIEPIIKKAKKAPGAPRDIERKIKDDMFTFAGTPWLLDYQSKDMYELVKFYYRPRVEAFISALRKELGKTKGIPSTPNLLLNPGFEEGENTNPANWHTDFVHKGGRASRSAEDSFEGNFSGKLYVPETGGYANLYQDIEVKPNSAYYLSARVKVKGECRASLFIDFMKSPGDWPGSVFAYWGVEAAPDSSEKWESIAGWFAPPKGTIKMRVYCRQEGVGTSLFDALKLQIVPLEKAPVVNPDELTALYRKIEEEWLEKPIEVKDKSRATMLQAVEEVFNSLKRFKPEIPSYIVPNEKVGAAGWEEDFSDISDWHPTYEGGIMTTDGQVARMESKSKWFLYGVDLSVPVKEFPILSFRYKVEEGDPLGHGAWIRDK